MIRWGTLLSIWIFMLFTSCNTPPPQDECLERNFGMANHSCEHWKSEGNPNCTQRRFNLPNEECIQWRDAGKRR